MQASTSKCSGSACLRQRCPPAIPHPKPSKVSKGVFEEDQSLMSFCCNSQDSYFHAYCPANQLVWVLIALKLELYPLTSHYISTKSQALHPQVPVAQPESPRLWQRSTSLWLLPRCRGCAHGRYRHPQPVHSLLGEAREPQHQAPQQGNQGCQQAPKPERSL